MIGIVSACGYLAQFVYKAGSQPLLDASPAVVRQTRAVKLVAPYVPGSVSRDVPYCSDQKMDIYHPRRPYATAMPAVVYIHGGGWVMNDKSSEADQLAMIDGLRDAGYSVIAINYRLVPSAYFPAPVADSLCAIRFLRAHADTYGIDANRLALYGFSAGGYLAAMVGFLDDDNPFKDAQYADYSSRVQAVITLAGLFDYSQAVNSGNVQRFNRMLNGADRTMAEPIRYITADDPPVLLLHGMNDQFVSPQQDELAAERLRSSGVPVEIVQVRNGDHGLNPRGGEPSPSRREVAARMAAFLEKSLKSVP